jgi:hypothetical protein
MAQAPRTRMTHGAAAKALEQRYAAAAQAAKEAAPARPISATTASR